MKCSLGIPNFLVEISSLSHSVVFLYFFALIPEEGFLISPQYSLELCIQMVYLLAILGTQHSNGYTLAYKALNGLRLPLRLPLLQLQYFSYINI